MPTRDNYLYWEGLIAFWQKSTNYKLISALFTRWTQVTGPCSQSSTNGYYFFLLKHIYQILFHIQMVVWLKTCSSQAPPRQTKAPYIILSVHPILMGTVCSRSLWTWELGMIRIITKKNLKHYVLLNGLKRTYRLMITLF